jgi:ADP-ribose pyrophosphatase YjhB (NUDIX family)
VVHDGRVLLIRRGKEPLLGRWTVPGGTVELGESLEQALVREMGEEASLEVEPLEVLGVFDRIHCEGERVVYHYVIVDYLCRWRGGEARAGSDALEVAWVAPDHLEAYDLPPKALEVVKQAFRRAALREGQSPDAGLPPTGDPSPREIPP